MHSSLPHFLGHRPIFIAVARNDENLALAKILVIRHHIEGRACEGVGHIADETDKIIGHVAMANKGDTLSAVILPRLPEAVSDEIKLLGSTCRTALKEFWDSFADAGLLAWIKLLEECSRNSCMADNELFTHMF